MEIERNKRVNVTVPVRINRSGEGEGLDISENGMYIYCSHTYIENTIIDITFTVEGREFNFSAKVSHVQPCVGFGVKFIEIPEDEKETLRCFIDKGEPCSGT